MKNIVIAAGYATRLGELTKNFPKPLLKIGEKSILGRMLDDIDRIPEIDEHIIITNHKFAHIFEEWRNDRLSASSGSPAQNPITSASSGSPAQNPITSASSGSPAQNPTTTVSSGSPAQNPITSASSGSPARNPITSASSGSPAQNPITSASSGSPAQNPITTVSSGSPAQNPITSASSGSPAQNPTTTVSSGSPAQNPITSASSGSPARNPITTVSSGFAARKPITIIDDGTETNETRLGAVCDLLFAMDKLHIDDDLLVVAADNLLFFSFQEFVDFAKAKGTSCIMCHEQHSVEKLQRTGVVELDKDMKVLAMEEKPQVPKSHWAVPPFYIYLKKDLDLVRQSVENGCGKDAPGNLAHYMVEHTTMHAWPMSAGRFDIGSTDTYYEACELAKEGKI